MDPGKKVMPVKQVPGTMLVATQQSVYCRDVVVISSRNLPLLLSEECIGRDPPRYRITSVPFAPRSISLRGPIRRI